MPQITVAQLANELGVSPATLVEQLWSAGVNKRLNEDRLTQKDKARLLAYLHKNYGSKEEKGKTRLPPGQSHRIKKSDSTTKASLKRQKRASSAKQFSGIITTKVADIRLEEPIFASAVEGNGPCSGCAKTVQREMVNTNHGTLALCRECKLKAKYRYNKQLEVKSLLPEKKRGKARKMYVLQGGAPGLGKRSL